MTCNTTAGLLTSIILLAISVKKIRGLGMHIALDKSLNKPNMCEYGFEDCARACMHNATCSQLEVVSGKCLLSGCGMLINKDAIARAFIKHRCPKCSDAPCENGGSCVDAENGYLCLCNPQTSGVRCQTSIDIRDLALIDGNTHTVSDSQLSSSGIIKAHSHIHSRLITITGDGIWGGNGKVTDWISARIATRGRPSAQYTQYITTYKISYSAIDEQSLVEYKENGQIKIFAGNTDHTTTVYNYFKPPMYARLVRLNTLSWFGWNVLGWELYTV